MAKEVVGFATSNAGVVLPGVSDAGDVAGVENGLGQAARAALVACVEGLCANVVKPRLNFS